MEGLVTLRVDGLGFVSDLVSVKCVLEEISQ